MAGLTEVPTEELLSFQDYPTTHTTPSTTSNVFNGAQINVDQLQQSNSPSFHRGDGDRTDTLDEDPSSPAPAGKSFWTVEYYQKFFDVDSRDVLDRILASVLPKQNNSLKAQIKQRPDLYGPFWISVTLVFTIAISGNIASYLQHANAQHHWRYDFHLVSYAATTIFLYISIIPLALWGLLKWSSDINDLEGLETDVAPKALELICIYGYSLFIYIPASILWTIQVSWLQWLLVIIAACISGSVLLFTLMPSFKLSRHKLLLMIGVIACHALLAAGFMLYFFHVPDSDVINPVPPPEVPKLEVAVEVVSHAAKIVASSVKST